MYEGYHVEAVAECSQPFDLVPLALVLLMLYLNQPLPKPRAHFESGHVVHKHMEVILQSILDVRGLL